MTKALTLSGSIRSGSYNRLLAAHMGDLLAARGVEVDAIDLTDFEMPIFNQDLEAEHTPQAAVELARRFAEADIIFIASPEYNGAMAPLTSNTMAWISRQKGHPFRHAVFGIGGVSSGKLGTVAALSHLRDLLSKAMALVASVDVRVGPVSDGFDAEGRLIDETALSRAEMLANQLVRLAGGGANGA